MVQCSLLLILYFHDISEAILDSLATIPGSSTMFYQIFSEMYD